MHPFVFIHIPRTGGTSVEDSLKHSGAIQYRSSLGKHAWARNVRERMESAGDGEWGKHFKFGFVRNPWDHMVSVYGWWCQKAGKWPVNATEVETIKNMKFPEFIRSEYGSRINEFFGTTRDWLIDIKGELIVDFVGRFETIDKDWLDICERIGLPKMPLQKINSTERDTNYRSYYDSETRDLVARRFGAEIEQFKYTF